MAAVAKDREIVALILAPDSRGLQPLFGIPAVRRVALLAGKVGSNSVHIVGRANVVIKKGNYRELPQMVSTIAAMDVRVSLSTYNCWRTSNDAHMLEAEDLPVLATVLQKLKQIRSHSNVLSSSDYYLDRIGEFFVNRGIPGCTAGINWIQVTPDGMVKRCSDHPVAGYYPEWHKQFFNPTACNRCWYSCRGAAQEPWTVSRFLTLAKDALSPEPRMPKKCEAHGVGTPTGRSNS